MLALLLAVLVVLLLQADTLLSPDFLQGDDYVEYWAAGRLNMTRANPYAPDQLLPLQLGIGRHEGVPLMMWNPPYTLAIAMPLAAVPYPISRFAWFLLQILSIAMSAGWLWQIYGGPTRKYWLAWAVAFTFYPTIVALQTGQMGAVLLLGVAGFLFFEGRHRYWLAGILASLTAIKPHVLYLFWVALLLWTVSEREWRVLLGAAAALLGGLAVAFLANPAVLHQYLHAVTTYPPSDWVTPTLGGLLRLLLGARHVYLQVLPMALGLAWLAVQWWRHRRSWRWSQQMPGLVLVSLLTTAYLWPFDMVVLLVLPISVAAWLVNNPLPRAATGLALMTYLAINLLAFARHGGHNYFESIWLVPLLSLWYVGIQWHQRRRRVQPVRATS